jgi:group I intron endonuclease
MAHKNEHPGKVIIYRATNKLSGKSYIGLTSNFKKRKYEHLSSSRNPKNPFAYAIRAHGEENFEWKIIFECNSREEANKSESFLILFFKTLTPGGYNHNLGGNSKWVSEETRKKISIAKKGKGYPKGAAHPLFGRKATPEQIANQIAGQSGDKSWAKTITSSIARSIYLDRLNGVSTKIVREKYGVSEDIVLRIVRKKTWKEILADLPDIDPETLRIGENSTSSKISQNDAESFISTANELFHNGIQNKWRQSKLVFEKYQKGSITIVYKILTKVRWKHLSNLIID